MPQSPRRKGCISDVLPLAPCPHNRAHGAQGYLKTSRARSLTCPCDRPLYSPRHRSCRSPRCLASALLCPLFSARRLFPGGPFDTSTKTAKVLRRQPRRPCALTGDKHELSSRRRPLRTHALSPLRSQWPQAACPVPRAVAQLRPQRPGRQRSRDLPYRLRSRHYPLRPGQ